MKRTLGAWLALSAALLTTEASAQSDEWDPDTHRSAAGGEIYSWSSDFGLHSAFIGFANIGFGSDEQFFIDVWLPVAAGVDGPGFDSERAGMGNPGVAFRYAPTMGIVRWWIGGGLGLPLNAVDDNDWQLETGFATASMGFWDSHMYLPDSFPLFVTGGADIRVHEWVSVQIGAKAIFDIEVDDRAGRDGFELILQNRVGAEFRHTDTGLGGGLHFKPVFVPTERRFFSDNFQSSIEAHFAYTGEVFFVRFGALFALDRPLGPAFDDGNVFSQHATLGGQW